MTAFASNRLILVQAVKLTANSRLGTPAESIAPLFPCLCLAGSQVEEQAVGAEDSR